MEIEFANKDIKNLYIDPDKYGKKQKLPKNIISELKIVFPIMLRMESCADFFKPANMGYKLEKMTKKKGLMSIRLDRKYRLTFYEINREEKMSFLQIKGIELVEVSNHYKD